ncbi:hypothetical protein SAMN02745150_01409 [Brevinema andersonii]|uniref:Uncharacterized protein n=1 Tax=Brevinema andersonii TaxID=34097 RepID=A0A1I1FC01_BREAD|nr:hypothetical protein [Brevinema andersonii]SFB94673.1 hypothetical protein SAMN02745150_01409 [Brevinema andersonii]
MQLFGAVNTSIPGGRQDGKPVLPSAGYFSQKLSGANVAPIGENLVLTTDYIISEISHSLFVLKVSWQGFIMPGQFFYDSNS